MDAVSGVGSRVHLKPDEDESTKAIVARDAKVTIHGYDKRFPQVKQDHQEHWGFWESASVGHAAYEGVELAEFHGVEHAASASGASAAGGPISGAAGALWLGIHELLEAHAKGDAQNASIRKDYAHVAVIGVLDLPSGYKERRLDGDYKHVARTHQNSDAYKMCEALYADRKGCALLQLHADRGMHAAADLVASKSKVEDFLKANPKVAEAYRSDPAFKEGFDAYLYTEAYGTAADRAKMKTGLIDRDGWNHADHVSIRV